MTKSQAIKLKRKIEMYAECYNTLTWKETHPAEDHGLIQSNYEQSKINLDEYIKTLVV